MVAQEIPTYLLQIGLSSVILKVSQQTTKHICINQRVLREKKNTFLVSKFDIPLQKIIQMKSISLKLGNQILIEADSILSELKTSRNKYINEAVEFYNKHHKRKLLENQLLAESKLVAEESMEVLADFEKLTDEI